MPRQAGVAIENNFRQGLITEASGLNFPENACTETYDCIFELTGNVKRRPGFNFESNYTTKTIDRTDNAVSTYLWKNAAGSGSVVLFVAQIGGTVYFWNTRGASTISGGALSSNITLSTYKTTGSPAIEAIACQFTADSKHLIITHPYCEPIYVAYDLSTNAVTGTAITIQIRDLEGDTADTNAIDARPATNSTAHEYNLINQGWDDYSGFNTAYGSYPSNCDVQWYFKDASGNLDYTAATVDDIVLGNTPAPKGHNILNLSDKDRDAVVTGATSGGTDYTRPATCAFYEGRIFYSGVAVSGYNSDIYYSQILEKDDQYGKCYSINDPSSEILNAITPADGGVITIPEAGTIVKLFAISGSLLVFANNGVWIITGSQGLGFRANDYTVQKISSVTAFSSTSFVDVNGFPAWWNAEGIYMMQPGQNNLGAPSPQLITLPTIKEFYDAIPSTSKLYARGAFNKVTGVVQWIYKSIEPGDPTDTYEFDRVLNFNTYTNAFYPWTISTSDVKVNAILTADASVVGDLSANQVIDDSSNTVIDDSSNNVVVFDFNIIGSAGDTQDFFYFVSYPSTTYDFTFALNEDTRYLDWYSYDSTGVDYDSYFISGYRIKGQASKKYSPTWLNIYSNTDETVAFTIQGVWDYAATSDTNRWSSMQHVFHMNSDYSVASRRLKIRGHGKALQFKINSESGYPFNIAGWSEFDTLNQVP